MRRTEPHIYVANWFYLAFILTIAVLHLVNNAAIPVSLFSPKSYIVWSGVQDAMVQWWYGHNAVGFFLTAGFLAIMYYFIPKRAERPIYSYRLSIIHFWALIFLYIWAGPHHLHYTALPDWAQTLGMTFSIMLWMPSWGGMINGLMTLSGAWDKLRTDPVLRMMVVSVAFYGMATFEGPLMSIKVGQLAVSHYTDWTIGHVHSGALGWVGYVSFGAIYCLVPWLWNRPLYSLKLVNWHFWISTIGIVLYITAMWVSGILQGLMWRAYTSLGFLEYSFIETVEAMHPFYVIRALGGVLFLTGALLMVWNLWQTVHAGEARAGARAQRSCPRSESDVALAQTRDLREELDRPRHRRAGRDRDRRPRRDHAAVLSQEHDREGRRRAALHAARTRRPQHLCARGLLQLPLADDPRRCATRSSATATTRSRPRACTTGRSSGAPSAPAPISRASAAKYSDDWHRDHLREPKSVVPGTVMPAYPWLAATELDFDAHRRRHEGAMRVLGVPYTPEMIASAKADVRDAGHDRRAGRDATRQALSQGAGARLRRQPGAHHRSRRADRLPAGARHAGRLQALRRQSQHPVRQR